MDDIAYLLCSESHLKFWAYICCFDNIEPRFNVVVDESETLYSNRIQVFIHYGEWDNIGTTIAY